jgi:hypothetical protein
VLVRVLPAAPLSRPLLADFEPLWRDARPGADALC